MHYFALFVIAAWVLGSMEDAVKVFVGLGIIYLAGIAIVGFFS